MISYVNEEYFRQDSIAKQIYITDFNDLTLHSKDIYIDGIELEETLCSDEDLRYGSCIASTLKFTTFDTADTFLGKTLGLAYFVNGDSSNPMIIGYYTVAEETLSDDRTKKEIVAKDKLYQINNADVTEWYDSLTFPMTLKNFRDSFFAYFGYSQRSATLVNDNMVIERTIMPSSISGADVIRAICEINGVFGHITRDNKFAYIRLRGTSVYSVTASMGISSRFEDYQTHTVDKIIIRQESNDIGVTYGSGDNTLVVQGNFLVYGIGSEPLATIAQNLYSMVHSPVYTPANIECIGNPCVEVGDKITVTTRDETSFPTYVLRRVLKGGQALRDNYEALGNRKRANEINSPQNQWLQLMGKSNVFERTLEQTTSQISDLSTAVTTVTQTASDLEIQVQSLQEQIDGETGYYEREGEPTMLNYPYWDFTTAIPCNNTIQLSETYTEDMQDGGDQFPHFYYSEQDRKNNMRALCIDLETGDGYRFVCENNVWLWKVIADSDFSILFNQITDLRVDVEGIESDVSNLEIDVADHESRISTNESNITQNADNISAEVSRATGAESDLSGRIDVQATSISAKVDATYGNSSSSFAWQLTSSGFYLFNNGSPIFSATSSGLGIEGAIKARSGYIGSDSQGFVISSKSIYNGCTSMSDLNAGVYLGTDGINLGYNFRVDKNGNTSVTSARFGKIKINSGNTVNDGDITFYSSPVNYTTIGRISVDSDNNSLDIDSIRVGITADSVGISANSLILNGHNYNQCLQQTLTSTNSAFRVLYSATADDTSRIEGARKGGLFYNPSTKALYIGGSISEGFIANPQTQKLYIKATSENDYGVCVGVQDSMWTFCPVRDNYMRLGSPSYRWGQIYSSVATINTSDKNRKKNIKTLANSTKDFIMELRPVSYKLKDGESGRTHYGLIAQEVEETMSKLGISDMDFAGFCKDTIEGKDTYGLRYEEFIPALIKVVQMQQKEIEELKKKVG